MLIQPITREYWIELKKDFQMIISPQMMDQSSNYHNHPYWLINEKYPVVFNDRFFWIIPDTFSIPENENCELSVLNWKIAFEEGVRPYTCNEYRQLYFGNNYKTGHYIVTELDSGISKEFWLWYDDTYPSYYCGNYTYIKVNDEKDKGLLKCILENDRRDKTSEKDYIRSK